MAYNKPLLFLAILLAVPSVWSLFTPEKDSLCKISLYSRKPCSSLPLTRESCVSRGCCFDARVTYGKCYRRSRKPVMSFGPTRLPRVTSANARTGFNGDNVFTGDNVVMDYIIGRVLGPDYNRIKLIESYRRKNAPNRGIKSNLQNVGGEPGYSGSKFLKTCNPIQYERRCGNSFYATEYSCERWNCCWDNVTRACYHAVNNVLRLRPSCSPGFTNPPRCNDINECLSNPCINGGICINLINSYQCQCPQPAVGPNCQLPCDSSPCLNNGGCNNVMSSYTCTCAPDFVGSRCETASTSCTPNPCVNGRCINGVNSYTCTCNPGWQGTNCDSNINNCSPNPCVNGACMDGVNSYTCTCTTGWQGTNCDSNIDDCSPNPCVNGACTDGVNSHTCACNAGWQGTNCDSNIDNCTPNPCVNGACMDGVNSYMCTCTSGWQGTNCDSNIDDCTPNPCVNGACTDGVNSYTCACTTGWQGATCNSNGNNCSPNPCVNGACTDGVNSYTCACTTGWQGTNCETNINDCSPNPCVNGACMDGVNSYTCTCTTGWQGTNCDSNIDDCSPNPCVNGACTDGVNSYTCACTTGWQGTNCDTNIDDCSPNPCVNGACTDGVNSYTCACTTGWQGTNCDSNIDDCSPNPCVNGACTDGVNSYTCACTTGWQGTNCDQDINECSESNNCAVCVNQVPLYFCICESGSYEGILCRWAIIGSTTYRVPATTTATSYAAANTICAGLDEGGGYLGEPTSTNLPTILTKVVASSTFVSGYMWINVVRSSGSVWNFGRSNTVATTNFESETNIMNNCAVMRISDFKWIIVSCTSFTADVFCERAITGKTTSP
ncbi:uncharacterized protein LOC100187196 isoform X24 [Ciona intestinalis]